MGTATSVLECSRRYPWLPDVNCTQGSVKYGEFVSNPSITGIGTDISFVLTAGLSLLVCGCVQLFCDRLRHSNWRLFFEPLVISFSDQQIVRGLSMSIAALYTSAACTIDAYRYNILCYLILMTIVSHLSSVLVLRSYTNGQVALELFRFVLVFAQIFFAGLVFSSRLTTTFPTSIPSPDLANSTTLVLPAACFQLPDPQSYSGLQDIPPSAHKDISGFSSYLVIASFYAVCITYTAIHIITLLRRKRTETAREVRREEERAPRWTWWWWLGIVRGMILLVAWIIWIWSVVKMYQFREWMNKSGWLSLQTLQQDNGWTFGQFLSLFLLAGAPLSLMNSWSDYKLRKADEKRFEQASRKTESIRHQPSDESYIEMQGLMRGSTSTFQDVRY